MEKVILHCDLNCFYASVEMVFHPEYRTIPMAVGGDIEERHGIILTKNRLAKKYHIQTGEPIGESLRKCPELLIIPPHYKVYEAYSRAVKELFYEYTDKVESFGIDEAWLDVTSSISYFGSAKKIADEIIDRINKYFGLTISIGISNNKIWAKLGSDLAEENEICHIKSLKDIEHLPVSELLMVGRATTSKLNYYDIYTIGDLANAQKSLLKRILGKNGLTIYYFANGFDLSDVKTYKETTEIKSIGNSTTTVRDLVSYEDVKMIFTVLADSIAQRLKDDNFYFKGVSIVIRDKDLHYVTYQKILNENSDLSITILNCAMDLFFKYSFNKPLRSIGISVFKLSHHKNTSQVKIEGTIDYDIKEKALDNALREIRKRYGYYSIAKANLAYDRHLTHFNPKEDHTIHPVSYWN